MLVSCPSCSAKFNVPDAKVAGKRARMKCKKCGDSISIDGTALSTAAPESSPPPGQSRRTSSRPKRTRSAPRRPPTASGISTRWRISEPSGKEHEMSLGELAKNYSDGRFEPGTLVCAPGRDDWLPPYDHPDVMDMVTPPDEPVVARPPQPTFSETTVTLGAEESAKLTRAAAESSQPPRHQQKNNFFADDDVDHAMDAFDNIVSLPPGTGASAAPLGRAQPVLSPATRVVGPSSPPPPPTRPSPVPPRASTSRPPGPSRSASVPVRSRSTVPPSPSRPPAPASQAPPPPSSHPSPPPPSRRPVPPPSQRPATPHPSSFPARPSSAAAPSPSAPSFASAASPRAQSYAPAPSFAPAPSVPVPGHAPSYAPAPSYPAAPSVPARAPSSSPYAASQAPSLTPSAPSHPSGPFSASLSEPTFGTITAPPSRRKSSSGLLPLFLAIVLVLGALAGIYIFRPALFQRGMNRIGAVLGVELVAATPQKAVGPPFDAQAAGEVLGQVAGQANSCRKENGPVGKGRAQVLYAPDGSASSVAVSRPFHETDVGSCLQDVFKKTRVPAFGGDPVVVSKTFEVK